MGHPEPSGIKAGWRESGFVKRSRHARKLVSRPAARRSAVRIPVRAEHQVRSNMEPIGSAVSKRVKKVH